MGEQVWIRNSIGSFSLQQKCTGSAVAKRDGKGLAGHGVGSMCSRERVGHGLGSSNRSTVQPACMRTA